MEKYLSICNILKFGVIHSLPHQTSHLDCVRPVNNNIVIVMDPNFERVDEGEFILLTHRDRSSITRQRDMEIVETSRYPDFMFTLLTM